MNKSKFNFHRDGDFLLVFRNHKPELKIVCQSESAAKSFEKYLKKTIDKDYDEFVEAYDLSRDTTTIDWAFNHIKFLAMDDESREILYLFKRIYAA